MELLALKIHVPDPKTQIFLTQKRDFDPKTGGLLMKREFWPPKGGKNADFGAQMKFFNPRNVGLEPETRL